MTDAAVQALVDKAQSNLDAARLLLKSNQLISGFGCRDTRRG
jgi:hypothetical protein